MATHGASTPDLDKATEQQWRVYGVINEWIRFADAKAGALLTLNGVLVAAAVGPIKDKWEDLLAHRPVLLLLAFAVAGLFVSAFYCLECIRPKLRVKSAATSSLSVPGQCYRI